MASLDNPPARIDELAAEHGCRIPRENLTLMATQGGEGYGTRLAQELGINYIDFRNGTFPDGSPRARQDREECERLLEWSKGLIMCGATYGRGNKFFAETLYGLDYLASRWHGGPTLLVNPYFGQGRSDKDGSHRNERYREQVRANGMMQALSHPAYQLTGGLWVDLHNASVTQSFKGKTKNLKTIELYAQLIKARLQQLDLDTSEVALFGPDYNSGNRVAAVAQRLSAMLEAPIYFGYAEKERISEDETRIREVTWPKVIFKREAFEITAQMRKKIRLFILLDDIMGTGGTLTEAADYCFNHALLRSVEAIDMRVTHIVPESKYAPRAHRNKAREKLSESVYRWGNLPLTLFGGDTVPGVPNPGVHKLNGYAHRLEIFDTTTMVAAELAKVLSVPA